MKHCPTIITALCACLLGHVPPRTSLFVFAFNSQYRRPFSRLSVQSTAAKSASISSTAENVEDVVSSDNNDVSWATHALLFSSLTDGILSNPGARSFLRYSLVSALLRKHIVKKEDQLKSSAEFSPCNGPNVDALNHLEHVDELNERGRQYSLSDNLNDSGEKTIDKWSRETLDFLMSKEVNSDALTVKIIYIPTAMYALNSESSNTPGKQRQRARADGKKRRTQLLRLVEELLFPSDGTDDNDGADGDDAVSLNLLAVTLDLDDGSIKQPEGSDDSSQFPKVGLTKMSEDAMFLSNAIAFHSILSCQSGIYPR